VGRPKGGSGSEGPFELWYQADGANNMKTRTPKPSLTASASAAAIAAAEVSTIQSPTSWFSISSMRPTLWTVGHSTASIESCLDLLRAHKIDAVADVRSAPYSARMPWFSESALAPTLKNSGIQYLWMGDQLGGRPNDPSHYDDEGHALYGLMSETSPFEIGIERIEGAASKFRLAIMCSEEDPKDCHRNTLIGTVLRRRERVTLEHIRHGRPEPETDEHLLANLSPSQRHLLYDHPFPDFRPVWRSTHSLRKPWPTSDAEEG
jgi:hypothetical protein